MIGGLSHLGQQENNIFLNAELGLNLWTVERQGKENHSPAQVWRAQDRSLAQMP